MAVGPTCWSHNSASETVNAPSGSERQVCGANETGGLAQFVMLPIRILSTCLEMPQ